MAKRVVMIAVLLVVAASVFLGIIRCRGWSEQEGARQAAPERGERRQSGESRGLGEEPLLAPGADGDLSRPAHGPMAEEDSAPLPPPLPREVAEYLDTSRIADERSLGMSPVDAVKFREVLSDEREYWGNLAAQKTTGEHRPRDWKHQTRRKRQAEWREYALRQLAEKLRGGMSKSEVRGLLGRPTTEQDFTDYSAFTYSTDLTGGKPGGTGGLFYELWVAFDKEGRLKKWSFSRPAFNY